MKIKNYIIFLVLCFVIFVIGIYLKQALKPPLKRMSITTMIEHYVDLMSDCLTVYYENSTVTGQDIETSEVVSFFENGCDSFSLHVFSKKPEKINKYDFGVFLLLPKELKSLSPTIIAYTTPIEKEKRIYRIALFLNGTNMTAVTMDSYAFDKVLGIDKLEKDSMPDFYYCLSVTK
ncbi:MAG: hypothetical protein JW787_13145 [Sedimentisphaerales bacterium]|nr:hypothetical protein [Sedimentisphaerales bacterium]